ncbi:hypothetical protein GCM10009836_10000 [Pseudonocardia ailaonensis]|uniref:Uncharacterized protein n=1 Tax=Pseudonocardia ailaonensis TaxID=367279 RepID=A0ABN2MSA6_9PSEU
MPTGHAARRSAARRGAARYGVPAAGARPGAVPGPDLQRARSFPSRRGHALGRAGLVRAEHPFTPFGLHVVVRGVNGDARGAVRPQVELTRMTAPDQGFGGVTGNPA